MAVDWMDLQLSVVVASLREVAPLARGNLLDVGCGDKPYEHIFRPFVDRYVGVEHATSFVRTSASARSGPDVAHEGAELPVADGSFETVLCVQVLEHTPDPAALLAEISRVVAPGGVVILIAPFSFRLHEEPDDYFRYTPHGLRRLFAAAGLEITEVRSQGSLWSLIGHKLNTFFALRVARMGRVAQRLGKLGHEVTADQHPRYWTLPMVVPAMAVISLAAPVLDRIAREPAETLGYLVLARPGRKIC